MDAEYGEMVLSAPRLVAPLNIWPLCYTDLGKNVPQLPRPGPKTYLDFLVNKFDENGAQKLFLGRFSPVGAHRPWPRGRAHPPAAHIIPLSRKAYE